MSHWCAHIDARRRNLCSFVAMTSRSEVSKLGRASFDTRSAFASFLQEQLPVLDLRRVPDQGRGWKLFGRARHREQPQACFMWQAVAFAGVYSLARPNEVFPRILATARTRQNVVEAALLRLEQLSRVLVT